MTTIPKKQKITGPDFYRALKQVIPGMPYSSVYLDILSGEIPTYPRLRDKGWFFVQPAGIPKYLKDKGFAETLIQKVLTDLGCL
ncbi:MAG: hypothetical protein K2X01_05135 [Cyanobacteria bacterium]|nr:hypothetical protein [Cyanobacteriota bacterium]